MKMTNKEAIEQVKTILKVRKEQKEIIECSSGNCINCNSDIEALEKVLNLIERQQQEIENSVPKEAIRKKMNALKQEQIKNTYNIDLFYTDKEKFEKNADIIAGNIKICEEILGE